MKLKVKLREETHHLDLNPGYTILSVLRRHQLIPPFSCTEGRCGKCRAKLISGLVHQEPGTGLGPNDRLQGYILTCRATGDSDEIEIQF